MKTITMVVEASPDSIGAYSEGDEGIYGMGETIGECRRSVQDAIDTIKESYPDHQIPDALKGEYELAWKYDMESLPNYYKGNSPTPPSNG